MNIIIEFNIWTICCLFFGAISLVGAGLRGVGRLSVLAKSPRWFGVSALANALGGAGLILVPIGIALSAQISGWLAILAALFPFALMLMGSLVEMHARAEPPYNQSLQQTVDPADNSAVAESTSASTAAELQR